MIKGLISIVVPVYNVEFYLKKCVDSLIKQDYDNFEIILVNDGSTDSSEQICDEYASKYENVIVFHKENGGLSDARNYGIEKAKGEYIYLIDSDDYLVEKDVISVFYNLAIKNDTDIVLGAYCEDIDGNKNLFVKNSKKEMVLTEKDAIENMYDYKNYKSIFLVAHNKLYKKELFNNIKYPKGKLHEDEFTTYKLYLDARKIVYIDYVTYAYLIRSGSIMTSKYTTRRMDALDALEERIEVLKKNKILTTNTVGYYLNLLAYNKYMLKKFGYEKELKLVQYKIKKFKIRIKENSFKTFIKIILLKYFDKMYFKYILKI